MDVGQTGWRWSISVFGCHLQERSVPNARPQHLLSLLRAFASSRELGEPADLVTEDGQPRIAAGVFVSVTIS